MKKVEKNIAEMFHNRAMEFSGRVALMTKKEGRYDDVTWDAFYSIVCDFSLGLSLFGIRKDEKVAILSESCPEWMYADLAILSLGAVTVPIFPTYRNREVEYIIKHSESRVVIISGEKQWQKVKRLKEQYGDLIAVISLTHFDCEEAIHFFDDIVAKGKAAQGEHKNVFEGSIRRIQEDDLATIIYTSGTTGPPKGVMLTHANFLKNCEAASSAISVSPGDIALSSLPLSHVFERVAGYYMHIYLGVIMAFAEGLQTLIEDLQLVRPHVGNLVPRVFEKFYHRLLGRVTASPRWKQKLFYWAMDVGKQKYVFELKKKKMPVMVSLAYVCAQLLVFRAIKKQFGGRIKFFIAGGAKLSKVIARFFYAADIVILEGYGLTETSPVVSVNRLNRNKFGTVGIPLNNVEVRIADDGEILVSGPNVMKGYYKDEQATSNVIRDGWLHTGDIGAIDEQGFLKITDRKKDIIVTSGGKNVSPQNIENLLKSDQYINQFFVYGDGEKYLSALVVPDFEQIEQYARLHTIAYRDMDDLVKSDAIYQLIKSRIALANKELTDYERIKKFVVLAHDFSVEKGELTATLKVKRSVVCAHYKDALNSLYGR